MSVEFMPTTREFFIHKSPLGKPPTLEDGDVVSCESGAIVVYILEGYAAGRLAPAIGSSNSNRGAFLQWLHFAESTAFPPLGIVVWPNRYLKDPAEHATLIAEARARSPPRNSSARSTMASRH